jgi:DNA-binding NarL/FixJ family response regulator
MTKPPPCPAPGTTPIFLVEDHPIVRFGLTTLIEQEPDLCVCGHADTVTDGLRLILDRRPKLAIIDICLKAGSGIDLVKRVRAAEPAVLMLVASMQDERLYAERALRAGARGYVTKEQTTVEIMHAIRTVLAGKIFLNPGMADHFLHRIGRSAAPAPSQVESLSDRELEIFSKIGQGRGTRDIASELHLSVKTVGTYRENIKAKLNLRTGSDLVRHAVEWLREQSQGGPVG